MSEDTLWRVLYKANVQRLEAEARIEALGHELMCVKAQYQRARARCATLVNVLWGVTITTIGVSVGCLLAWLTR